uniref:DUF6598 domain-containing protein n=1 Tax=Aegilops tauschii subsp. strangulata TaxID=200361 RepID=A0A452Y004_AEGTS
SSMAGGDSSPVAAAAAATKWEWDQEEYRCEPAEYSVDPRYSEYDPKQGCFICVRYFFDGKLDLDEESPVGPMRHTGKIFKEGFRLKNSVNVVSIKIVSSDYGYPLYVYGTIIARDSLDRKCVYIFRRDQDDCQLISSKVLLPQTHTIYQCVFSCTGTSYQSSDLIKKMLIS